MVHGNCQPNKYTFLRHVKFRSDKTNCLFPGLFQIKETSPPMSTFGQLLWREFFYTAATKNPNFDRMLGNPICVQIPWDDNPEALAKWASGKTGFPWIDAIMTQLREEGWIHHLARHSVACFLTRGHLWISWEDGMKVSITFFIFRIQTDWIAHIPFSDADWITHVHFLMLIELLRYCTLYIEFLRC